MTTQFQSERTPFRIPWWVGCVLLSGIALFFLWEEHRAHILGALPWLLFLACPLIHFFLHRGHGHGGGTHGGNPSDQTSGAAVKPVQQRGDEP